MPTTAIEPAPIRVPQADLDDLRERLARTRWSDAEPVDDWSQGAPLAAVRTLCAYWREGYDWRRCEAMLNRWSPQRTVIDGLGIHFFHVPPAEPDALPEVMTHGWPGSVIEFARIIGPLIDPRAHGGDPADAVSLVLPALPGHGFSDKPRETGWSLLRIADAWVELMRRLGVRDDTNTLPVDLPAAFSRFPADIGGPSRRWAGRRFSRIVRWVETDRGGHLPAFEQPELFVEEVRAGLRALRQAG